MQNLWLSDTRKKVKNLKALLRNTDLSFGKENICKQIKRLEKQVKEFKSKM